MQSDGPWLRNDAEQRSVPSICSFHLRQLAKYGFVEEAGGGHGRARPWRLSSIGMSFSPGGDAEAEIATDAVMNLFRERQFARYQAWRQTKAPYPQLAGGGER